MFERNKRAGTKRQLFLMDQRVIITKEKDADGLFVFKDSLKVHSLSVAEKEGDSPTRFAVGTGTVGSVLPPGGQHCGEEAEVGPSTKGHHERTV